MNFPILLNGDKRHFSRGELKRKQEAEYWAKRKVGKFSTDSPFHDGSPGGSPRVDSLSQLKEKSDHEKDRIPPRAEVIRRLRERLHPIRLFGESDYDSYQRMKRLQVLESDGRGLGNDFIAAMDKVDAADMHELFAHTTAQPDGGGGAGGSGTSSLEVAIKQDELDQEELARLRDKLIAAIEEDKTFSVDCEEADIVLRYFKFIFSTWGRELNSRSKQEKQSFLGKMASATYTQTLEYIKPLFRQLKHKQFPPDILHSLVKIASLCMDRNYIKANDAYLELAIGNSPWPLGVTNHGIHSRTAQEKIYAKNVAHVLNDETQRKFIQAIKRLMTHAQRMFTTDPSRCVNYMGTE